MINKLLTIRQRFVDEDFEHSDASFIVAALHRFNTVKDKSLESIFEFKGLDLVAEIGISVKVFLVEDTHFRAAFSEESYFLCTLAGQHNDTLCNSNRITTLSYVKVPTLHSWWSKPNSFKRASDV